MDQIRQIIFTLFALLFMFVNSAYITSCGGPKKYIDDNAFTSWARTTPWKRCEQIVAHIHVVNSEVPDRTVVDKNFTNPFWFTDVDSDFALYYPQVDEFSALTIPLTSDTFAGESSTTGDFSTTGEIGNSTAANQTVAFMDDEFVYIWLNISGVATLTPRYFKSDRDTFASAMTATVYMNNGNITGIEWDDDRCKECNSDYYVSSNRTSGEGCNCGFKYSEISCSGNGTATIRQGSLSNLCDLKVYLVWKGTDGDNKACQSYSSAPSEFAKYSALSVFETAAGVASNQYIP